MRKPRAKVPAVFRFWPKVDLSNPDGCWLWIAGRDSQGYGIFNAVKGKPVRAHQFSFWLQNGPVPVGLELDHLCHTWDVTCPGNRCLHRTCVNPLHLEPVTHAENTRRGRAPNSIAVRTDLCGRGHSLAEEAHTRPDGGRLCRACVRLRWRERAKDPEFRAKHAARVNAAYHRSRAAKAAVS